MLSFVYFTAFLVQSVCKPLTRFACSRVAVESAEIQHMLLKSEFVIKITSQLLAYRGPVSQRKYIPSHHALCPATASMEHGVGNL